MNLIEDELVSLDELQEKCAEFEDYVQSTDVAAMQSLSSFLYQDLTQADRVRSTLQNSDPGCLNLESCLDVALFYYGLMYLCRSTILGSQKKIRFLLSLRRPGCRKMDMLQHMVETTLQL